MSDDTTNIQDAIDSLFRQAEARDQLNRMLDGKTADERRDIIILLLCRVVGGLADQNQALTERLVEAVNQVRQLADLVSTMSKKIDELERQQQVNVRGPFIRRILDRD